MSTEEPPVRTPKRQRTEDPQHASAATRHQVHWYRDGSIVLRVQDVLFCVHQTALEKLSEVFKDLFSLPKSSNEERIDGSPVVRLQGDDSADWAYLLDAIYDQLHFDALASRPAREKFPRLSGILRLSTKYGIIAFRRKTITILSTYYPSGDIFLLPKQNLSVNYAFETINLARSTNALTLLPSAFVKLTSIHNKEEIIDNAPISIHDKLVVYRGMHRLVHARNNDMLPFAYRYVHPDGCTLNKTCNPVSAFNIPLSMDDPMNSFFPVSGKFADLTPYFCATCLNRIQSIFHAGRQKTWERLPAIFDLGKGWDELRRIKAYDSTP
ncbi:hypothetical protein GGF50DRAFT_43276 [Schizophyllum commune]